MAGGRKLCPRLKANCYHKILHQIKVRIFPILDFQTVHRQSLGFNLAKDLSQTLVWTFIHLHILPQSQMNSSYYFGDLIVLKLSEELIGLASKFQDLQVCLFLQF